MQEGCVVDSPLTVRCGMATSIFNIGTVNALDSEVERVIDAHKDTAVAWFIVIHPYSLKTSLKPVKPV